MLNVTAFIRDDGACGFYRIFSPLSLAAEQNLIDLKLNDITTSPEHVIHNLSSADVVVIPRPFEEYMIDMITQLKKHGKKIIIDHDDNMFAINPASNHYEEFGTEECTIEHNGQRVNLWTDGINIDTQKNKQRIDGFKKCLELADAVTVTQPILAEAYKPFAKKVYCLPNCINSKIWQPVTLPPREDVRLFWSGGSSHYEDIKLLDNVLPEICKKYPNVKVVMMGQQWTHLQRKLGEQFIYEPWVHNQAYPYKQILMDIDISMIPLADNYFNSCKSNLKYLEQSFLKRPSIISDVSPYKEDYKGDNMILAANSDDAWYAGLCYLIDKKEHRSEYGDAAFNAVQGKYEARKNAHMWADVYNEVMHNG